MQTQIKLLTFLPRQLCINPYCVDPTRPPMNPGNKARDLIASQCSLLISSIRSQWYRIASKRGRCHHQPSSSTSDHITALFIPSADCAIKPSSFKPHLSLRVFKISIDSAGFCDSIGWQCSSRRSSYFSSSLLWRKCQLLYRYFFQRGAPDLSQRGKASCYRWTKGQQRGHEGYLVPLAGWGRVGSWGNRKASLWR